MSPVPTTPRLSTLDPLAVAVDVCTLVVHHRARVALYLSPGADALERLDPAALARSSDLGLTVIQLVAFARDGSLGDWPDASCAVDAMQTVCECIYSQAGVPGTFAGGALDWEDEAGLDEPIGVAMLAAHARYRLSTSGPVPLRELAALGDVGARRMRQLTEAGELRARDGMVRAGDACRWLAARDVPGFRALPK